jgi:hypothetical protein
MVEGVGIRDKGRERIGTEGQIRRETERVARVR